MEIESVCQISTLLTLLEGSLSKVQTNMFPVLHLERVFLYCVSWGLGGLLHEDDRYAFDSLLRVISPLAMPPKVPGRVLSEGRPPLVNHPLTFQWKYCFL